MLAVWLTGLIAYADPENFVVGEFTFVRPTDWQWVWDEKRSKIGNLLDVPGDNKKDTTPVFFRKFSKEEGNPESRRQAWLAYFKELPEDLHIRSEIKTVAGYEITYFEMEGRYVRPPYPDHALIGATVKVKNGYVAVRMSGKSKIIEQSKATFREMIEHAVKTKQGE